MRTIYYRGDKKTEFVQGKRNESDIQQRGQAKISEMMESEEYILTFFSPTVQEVYEKTEGVTPSQVMLKWSQMGRC